jgi:hypothetical protein
MKNKMVVIDAWSGEELDPRDFGTPEEHKAYAIGYKDGEVLGARDGIDYAWQDCLSEAEESVLQEIEKLPHGVLYVTAYESVRSAVRAGISALSRREWKSGDAFRSGMNKVVEQASAEINDVIEYHRDMGFTDMKQKMDGYRDALKIISEVAERIGGAK